jgi:small neutral amino acid transporter SnatA (MarC family)
MISRKILGMIAAILIFLGVVLLSGFLINFFGYDSSNITIRVLSWLLGSMIAFTAYNWIIGEDEA